MEMTNVTASLWFKPKFGPKEHDFSFGSDRQGALQVAREWVESQVEAHLADSTLDEGERVVLASLTEDGPEGPADSPTEEYVSREGDLGWE